MHQMEHDKDIDVNQVNEDESRMNNGGLQDEGGARVPVDDESTPMDVETQKEAMVDEELDYSDDVSGNLWRMVEKKANMVRLATEITVSKHVPLGKRREEAMRPVMKSLEELSNVLVKVRRNCVDDEMRDTLLKFKVFTAQKLYDIVDMGGKCMKVVAAAKLLVGELELENIVEELGRKAMLEQDIGRELETDDCEEWPRLIAAEREKAIKCYERCMELEKENEYLKGGIKELRCKLQVSSHAKDIPPEEEKELLQLEHTPGNTPERQSEYPTTTQMDFIAQCGTYGMLQDPRRRQSRRSSPLTAGRSPSPPVQTNRGPPLPTPQAAQLTGGNAAQGNNGYSNVHNYGYNMWHTNAQTQNVTNTNVMEMLLRANITPEVGTCEDGRIDKFDSFIRMFEAKYGFFGDSEKRDYLTARFKGKIAHIYEGLSKEVKEGSYYGIVSGIRNALKGDERMVWQKSQEKLKHLTAEPGRLRRYCEELERLTSIVHDESGPVGLSKVRASELWTQVKDTPMGLSLLETYESTDPQNLYSELKSKALRLEELLPRQGNMFGNHRMEYSRIGSPMSAQNKGYGFEFSQDRNAMSNRRPAPTNFRQYEGAQQRAHGQGQWNVTRNSNGSAMNTNSELRCYNCNGLGHTSRFCTSPRQQQNPVHFSAKGNNDSNEYGRPFQQATHMQGAPPTLDRRTTTNAVNVNVGTVTLGTVTHLIRRAEQWNTSEANTSVSRENAHCNAVKGNDDEDEVYGKKFLKGASFLGMTTEVLIDSGAQPSIMPLEFMTTADRNGIDLTAATQLVNVDSNALIDASGGLMHVICVVKIPIKLKESGREANVVFHVVKQGPHAAKEPIIGTNAFGALGIELRLRQGNDEEVVKDPNKMEGEIRLRQGTDRKGACDKDCEGGEKQSSGFTISLAKVCRRVEVVQPMSEFNKQHMEQNAYNKQHMDLKSYKRGVERKSHNKRGVERKSYNKRSVVRKGYNKCNMDHNFYNKRDKDKKGYNHCDTDHNFYNKRDKDKKGYNHCDMDHNFYNKRYMDRKLYNKCNVVQKVHSQQYMCHKVGNMQHRDTVGNTQHREKVCNTQHKGKVCNTQRKDQKVCNTQHRNHNVCNTHHVDHKNVAQITSKNVTDCVPVDNAMYFRPASELYHPLDPRFRCGETDMHLGGHAAPQCKWSEMSCARIEGVQWKGAGEGSIFCGEAPKSLLDLAKRVQLVYGGQTLENDLKERLNATFSLDSWAVAAAVKTARLHCGHVAAALSLLDVGLGSTTDEVEKLWRSEGVDWKNVARELVKTALKPDIKGDDIVFVPQRLEEMRSSINFPGGPTSPRGIIYGLEDASQLESLLEKRRIRAVFVVLSSQDDARTAMELVQTINRTLYKWNLLHLHNVKAYILSPPVIGSVDNYNNFHKRFLDNFNKWCEWRREENRAICVVSFTHNGEMNITLDDYCIAAGLLSERRLTKHECFSFIKGIRTFLRGQGLTTCFDVCHMKEISSASLKRPADSTTAEAAPPKTYRSDDRGDRGEFRSGGVARGRGQWRSTGRGRGYRGQPGHSHHY